MGPSSDPWDSPHLKGLFHLSPASLFRVRGSAVGARVSASSLIHWLTVFGLLGEGMKLRKVKGPAPPASSTQHGEEGLVWAHVRWAGVLFPTARTHESARVLWTQSTWRPREDRVVGGAELQAEP